jgi:hypothetical protein
MTSRRRPALAVLVVLGFASGVSGEETAPDVQEVLARAVEKALANEEAAKQPKYGYRFVTRTETMGKNGEVESVEERVYEALLIEGFVYERLVAIDGRALGGAALEAEKKREASFRRKVAAGEAGPATGKARRGDSEDRVTFDDALVSRYVMNFLETRKLDGRSCHALSFVPKKGPLPADGRFDELLNNAAGTLCIDAETFEVAHLRFELQSKVSFWWGVLGSVSEMKGELERRPVAPGAWFPQSFELYVYGRKLLRPMHLRESFLWHDYRTTQARRDEGAVDRAQN